MGVLGTNITQEDAETIIKEIQGAYAKIPPLVKCFMPSVPELLQRIPSCARRYTLDELIQLIDWMRTQNLI